MGIRGRGRAEEGEGEEDRLSDMKLFWENDSEWVEDAAF
jgi:hypothetical protein